MIRLDQKRIESNQTRPDPTQPNTTSSDVRIMHARVCVCFCVCVRSDAITIRTSGDHRLRVEDAWIEGQGGDGEFGINFAPGAEIGGIGGLGGVGAAGLQPGAAFGTERNVLFQRSLLDADGGGSDQVRACVCVMCYSTGHTHAHTHTNP